VARVLKCPVATNYKIIWPASLPYIFTGLRIRLLFIGNCRRGNAHWWYWHRFFCVEWSRLKSSVFLAVLVIGLTAADYAVGKLRL